MRRTKEVAQELVEKLLARWAAGRRNPDDTFGFATICDKRQSEPNIAKVSKQYAAR